MVEIYPIETRVDPQNKGSLWAFHNLSLNVKKWPFTNSGNMFNLQFINMLERQPLYQLRFSLFDILSANAESRYDGENFPAALLCSPPVRQGNLMGDFEFLITQLKCHAPVRPLTKHMDARKS